MTIAELKQLVGKNVIITFKDDKVQKGVLGFTEDFSEKYMWRKPNYFTINDYDFKVSHIKKCEVEK